MLQRFAGGGETLRALAAALAGGSLPHAVLLCAPDGCGRNYAARLLAADYLYPGGGPAAEAVLRGEGSEVLLAEGEGKSGQISIARIRALRADVHLSALSAAGRVVLIRDAHRMAAPAANALLKVLEEPPAEVLFLLTAHSPDGLPATIASRCARYTLAPLSAQSCREMLQTSAPAGAGDLPALLAVLYDGRCGLGLAVLRDAGRQQVLRDALSAARAAALRDEYALMRLFSSYEGRAEGERERRDALLFDLVCVLDAALRGVSADGLAAMPPGAAALLLEPVLRARAALAANAAPKITFTALCTRLACAGL